MSAEERAKPVILPEINFEGHAQRYCGEHRTVGPHRAWCFDDREWCYPDEPCRGCDESAEVKIARAVAAERQRIRDGAHRYWSFASLPVPQWFADLLGDDGE